MVESSPVNDVIIDAMLSGFSKSIGCNPSCCITSSNSSSLTSSVSSTSCMTSFTISFTASSTAASSSSSTGSASDTFCFSVVSLIGFFSLTSSFVAGLSVLRAALFSCPCISFCSGAAFFSAICLSD